MKVTAYQKYIRQSPRKLRLVADAVRGLSLATALNQLSLVHKSAAKTITQVLTQAKANAINNARIAENTLKIDSIIIEAGPTFKRWNPVSRGRAHPILKRTSHIKVTVAGSDAVATK